MPTSPTRRAVLLALPAAAALAGCSTPWGRLRVQPLGGDPPPSPPPPGPDELARRSAVEAVQGVLGRAGGLDPALAGPLGSALAEQLEALGEQPATASAPPAAAGTAAAPGTTTTAPAASPAAPAPTTPAEVAAAARDAAQTASADLAGVAGGTARLLACVAAGLEAARAWLLSGEPPPTGPTQPPAPGSSSSPSSSGPAGPAGSPTPAQPSGEQAALVAALGVEQAAEYGYGVLAVRLGGADRDLAVGLLATHGRLVEQLREQLLALGAQPPAPQPAWALPSPVTDAAGALALAQQLEAASAAAWADLVAAADRERRAAAADQLVLAAQRWQQWRAAAGVPGPVGLPGLSGR
ncbi:DUF4439 domain-containing protein [Quadrisphaera sp. KR29]|uniref:DUF4439 domain-containing protein n=1 Tax=Quadrisphaera sp. KR29 TaxID=3461391 RepID=UPI00404444FA